MIKFGHYNAMKIEKTGFSSFVIRAHETFDTLPMPNTSHKLNGQNYIQWSQSVMMLLCGRSKEDYVTGTAVAPKKTNPKFKVWNAENNLVMSWLMNSMATNIKENFLLFIMAKDIWEALRDTYSTH